MTTLPLLRRVRRRLFAFQLLLLLVGACAVAYAALSTFEADLQPDMTRKGELVARSLAAQIERALDAGIPFDGLRGAEDVFASMRSSSPEILYTAAADTAGTNIYYEGTVERESILAELSTAAKDFEDWSPRAAARVRSIHAGDHLLTGQPVLQNGVPVGAVLVGIDAHYIEHQISEMIYDILIILVVSLLLTFELLLLIMASAAMPIMALQAAFSRLSVGETGARVTGRRWSGEAHRLALQMGEIIDRLQGRYAALATGCSTNGTGGASGQNLQAAAAALDAIRAPSDKADSGGADRQDLVRVRMPLFVFFVAEELSRPFFPVFARSMAQPIAGLSPELVVSLPMMLFMLVVALSQPLGGPWAERLGARRLMIVGAGIGAIGLVATATAESLWLLLAWRFITAAGYGLVFVGGQSWVVTNTVPGNRAWGLAMFVGSVLASSICGPAIGGLIADRIGYRPTFLIGAMVAVFAAFLAWRLLPSSPSAGRAAGRPLRARDIATVMRNPKFVALTALGAMPAKIALTGFLYYLVPMYLASLGSTPSAAGRIMMLYGLMMVLFTPLAARLNDKLGRPLVFVVAGGMLSGAGLSAVLGWPSAAGVIVGVVVLGLAQSISITPQLALVPTACPRECRELGQVTVIGFFRLFERLGSALGPVLAGFLLQSLGYVTTIVIIGGGIGCACLLLAVVWRLATPRTDDTRERSSPTPSLATPRG